MTPEPVPTTPGVAKLASLDKAVTRATKWLLSRQQEDGHWVFELEADATIPAEYVLLQHYLDTIDADLEQRIARYLRATQEDHGGWPLYRGGAFDLSASVKQAAEFGLTQKATLAGFVLTIQNIPALTLQATQGMLTVNAWYWDLNDATRAWARRFEQRFPKHQKPNDMHAGVYSSVLAYLKAVDKVG